MTRGLSLCFAFTLSLVGLVFPFLRGANANGLNQSILMVMMLGIVGAFIHGAGFRPKQPWLRWLISPAVCWPVMLVCGGLLVATR
jgi:predicted membrane protein